MPTRVHGIHLSIVGCFLKGRIKGQKTVTWFCFFVLPDRDLSFFKFCGIMSDFQSPRNVETQKS